jgi:MFS family permease
MRGEPDKKRIGSLLAYNIAIGFAYFLVEIMLIQAYHSVFLSPSASLILVLAVLLIGSGFGGLLAGRLSLFAATCALAPLLLLGVRLPDWLITSGWAPSLVAGATVATVFAIGFLMGVFFPTGLQLADRWQMRGKIPHLFAINSAAGSLATVVSLYLGVRLGYSWTLIMALVLYALAAVTCHRQRVATQHSQQLAATTRAEQASEPANLQHEAVTT